MAVDDGLPGVLWTANFMRAQGYDLEEVVVMQDNQSTMLLETRGKASSSRRTRHLDIPFFFIKDKIDKKEVVVKYEPTEEIISDFEKNPYKALCSKSSEVGF